MKHLCVAVCGVVASACGGGQGNDEVDLGPAPPRSASAQGHVELNPRVLRRFRPLEVDAPPPQGSPAAARIALGKQLFFDTRLSRNHDVSCNTCHPLDHAGVDARSVSLGTSHHSGSRNAPSVYNTAEHIAQFWDGRAANLEEQVKGPLLNGDEMAMDSPVDIAKVIRSIPGYVVAFEHAFPDERGERIDLGHIELAIASFERTLATPSRWDRFLLGDQNAITLEEKEGVKVFADIGCVQCHTGELVGASMFQKVGAMTPWPNQTDLGRYEVTHLDADRMVFKVPSLRNVALTAPYFHDGSVADLPTAIWMMGKHQLGIELTPREVKQIGAWLASLTGELPTIDVPKLP